MRKGEFIRDAHFPGRTAIEAYGQGGFRFADMSHRGSLLCLPSGIHGWSPLGAPLPTLADLAPVFAEATEIEHLLIGTGETMQFLPPEMRARLRDVGIVAETMSTGAAVRSFNVLLAEDRAVAAALIAVD